METKKAKKDKGGYRGDVPGCHVGQVWDKRMDMVLNGMHQQSMAGIDGREDCGCYSIVISGGYEDDEDHGEEIIYTGSGGQNSATRVQERDQEFKGRNASLVVSCNLKYPVRVIRGFNSPSPYAPANGYRYDGLYEVESFWKEKLRGFDMCRFRLKRLPGQPDLPPPRTDYKVKRKKRTAGASSRAPLYGDLHFLTIPIDAAVNRASEGFCVVCEKKIEGGCTYQHIEKHIQELWATLGPAEQQKVTQRVLINAERINKTVEALTSPNPIVSESPAYHWP